MAGFVCLFGIITVDGVAVEMARGDTGVAGMGAVLDQARNHDLLPWIIAGLGSRAHLRHDIGRVRSLSRRSIPLLAAVAVAVAVS